MRAGGCVARAAGTRLAAVNGHEDYEKDCSMNFIIWIVVGGILGWIASMIMGTNDRQGMFLNIIVGIVGAFLGGLLLAPLFNTGTINQGDFSAGALLVSLAGAVILLAIVNMFRRRRVTH
jgi:uncharacterized membrane protein YeaQ/YmgE (transglycosylase-associated protein family)